MTERLPSAARRVTPPSLPLPPRHVAIALAVTVAAGLFTWALFKAAGNRLVTARRDDILPVLLGAGVLLVALPRRLLPYGAATTAVAWTLAHLGVKVVPDVISLRTPVDQAVGGAAFTGTEYRPAQIGVALATLLALLGAAAISFALRRRTHAAAVAEPEPDRVDPATPRTRHPRPWGLVAGTAVLALVIVPQLGTSPWGMLAPGWDSENLIAWDWAIDRGLSPMDDFFFPYSETWVFLQFPWGPLWEWLARSAVLAFAGWAMWRLGPPEGRVTRALFAVAFLVLLGVYSPFYWRYGLAVVFVAAYAALGPGARRRPGREHMILAVAATYIAFNDPSVLAQAAVGCVFVVLADLLARRLTLVKSTIRRLLVDAVPFVAAGCVLVLVWMLRHSFDENVRWWLSATATSAASAPDEQTVGALWQHIALRPTLDMIYIGASFLVLGVGIAHLFSSDRRSVAVSRLCLGVAGVGVVFLLKHVVRPQGPLTLIAPLMGLGWAAVLLWDSRRMAVNVAVGAFVAAVLFSFESGAGLTLLREQVAGVPDRVERSVDVVGDQTREHVARRRLFTPVAYAPDTTPTVALAQILREQMASSPRKTFAVLGDAQSLYYFLNQPPPFHVQLYNAAPRAEQEAVVDSLEREHPQFLFWRRDAAVDGVPPPVRAPLIHRYSIDHYVPVPAFAKPQTAVVYDVLTRRTSQPIPVDWWRSRLGDTVDLGFIPYSSNGDEESRCTGGDGCAPYLIARRRGGRDGPVTVTLTAGGRPWKVVFQTRGDEDSYAVRLDRLWFAPFLGAKPSVGLGTPGWSVELKRVRAGDALY